MINLKETIIIVIASILALGVLFFQEPEPLALGGHVYDGSIEITDSMSEMERFIAILNYESAHQGGSLTVSDSTSTEAMFDKLGIVANSRNVVDDVIINGVAASSTEYEALRDGVVASSTGHVSKKKSKNFVKKKSKNFVID